MTYHRPPDLPLSSFDPRYKELLLRGAQKEFTLTFETLKEARGFRALIHTYRSRAKKHFGDAGREEWEPLYLCAIYLVKAPAIQLRFAPRHDQFSHILAQLPDGAEPPKLESGVLDIERLELEQKAHEEGSGS